VINDLRASLIKNLKISQIILLLLSMKKISRIMNSVKSLDKNGMLLVLSLVLKNYNISL